MTLKYFKQLAYEEMGEENDETIIFLHTKLLDKWIWKKQKEDYDSFFKDYHCIFPDLPNHGDSKSEEEFSISRSATYLIEFMENLIDHKKIDKINIIGLGLGGSIAIEILNRNPQIIGHLILSGIEISDAKETQGDDFINELAKTQSLYLNEKPDAFIVKAYLRYFGITKEYFYDMEKILDRTVKEEENIAFESLNYTIPIDLTTNDGLLEKENILIIFGNKEDLNCTKSAIQLKSLFENGKLIEINKGNHLWNIIDRELFNSIVIEFIKSGKVLENTRIRIIK